MTAPASTPLAPGFAGRDAPSLTNRAQAIRNQLIGRVDTIDLVRGLVMVIMLLDHTRDFTHASGVLTDPANVETTTPILFFTRWITHLCAPTFVFLAGTSTGIQRIRGTSPADLSRFLWTRGLWLIFLELTVVRMVIWWTASPAMLAMLQVIWAIGVSMIVLAALVRLPMRAIGYIGLAIVLSHNLLDGVRLPGFQGPNAPMPTALAKLWMVFHQGGVFPIGSTFPGPMVLAMYPLIPWIGVMLAGYGFAELYAWPAERRRTALYAIGAACIALFFMLRLGNLYGDPQPWSMQNTTAKSVISFFNVTKYGPSLQFCAITLGISILTLAALEGKALTGMLSRVFVTFGRVPMFFYILQWISAHVFGLLVAAAYGRGYAYFFHTPFDDNSGITAFGGPLWLTYACWIAGAIIIYVPCRWYAGLKARRKDLTLLRYL